MEKILAIIRTSTERQETESQKNEVKDFCISKGYKSNQIVFIEVAGASARKLNDKYIQMIESIKSTILADKDVKAVALWHLNRLGRVESKLIEMKDFFIENKIQVYIKEPSLTLLNDDGTVNNGTEIVWSMFATMVKQDTQELFAKFERGRNANRKEGKFNGGAYGALYGYMVDKDGYIIPNVDEAKQLNDVFELYASGKYSIRSLAKELQQRGWNMRGRKYSENNLHKILSNTSYIGYSSKTNRKYEPIINEELFRKVEAIRKGNDLNIKSKESKNINLAIKILKCQYCGHNYVATKNKYTCYKHLMKTRFDEDCENSVSISIELMDSLLWEVAKIKHLDYMQDFNMKEIEDLKKEKKIYFDKIDVCYLSIDKLDNKKNRTDDLYINGNITKVKYDTTIKSIESEVKTNKQNIKLYQKYIKDIDDRIANLSDIDYDELINLSFNLDECDKAQQKEIVNKHIKEAFVEHSIVNGKKAILIDIRTFDDISWKWIYFYTYKQKEKQLWIVNTDGSMHRVVPTEEDYAEATQYIKDNDLIRKTLELYDGAE